MSFVGDRDGNDGVCERITGSCPNKASNLKWGLNSHAQHTLMDSFTDEAKLFIGGIAWDTTEERLRDHFSHYGEVAHAVVMRDRVTSQPRGFGFVVFSDPSIIPSVLQQTHNIDGRTVILSHRLSCLPNRIYLWALFALANCSTLMDEGSSPFVQFSLSNVFPTLSLDLHFCCNVWNSEMTDYVSVEIDLSADLGCFWFPGVEAKRAMSREQQQTMKTGSNSSGGNFVGSDNLKSKKIFVGGLPSTLTEDEFRGYFQDFGSVTDVVIMNDSNTGRPRGFGFISFTTEDSVDRVLQKTFHELKGKLVEVKRALPKDAVTGAGSRGNSRGYGSHFSSNESYNSPLPSSRMLQQTQPTNGGYQPNQPTSGGYQQGQPTSIGYPPYSVYGGASYGYAGNSNPGYGAYGGYDVGGHGSANAGYSGPAGVYGNLGSPNTDFLKNQWSSQQAGYGASGYGQTGNYGASVPWSNASRSGASGYAQAGRPPSGASQYVNKGYNFNGMQMEERGPVGGTGDYTNDGTVDLKGRPVLISSTGKWKACYFIVGYEVFERMAYYGIASNLGMVLLTLVVSLPALRPLSCVDGVKDQDCD
ncbi:hypothetical protein SASPL_107129 [Salvia splendens]|uniref:RRM domain-containing protein n=1 Tax=Salvia splendens TaxID=180675 RepID=A0A8X8Y9T7_SALSN|nr:hypothetical protein SASPL_107129 [Salvia splendens]